MDVQKAYLASKVDDETYVDPLEGLDAKKNEICRLEKGLYGVKQLGRVYNQDYYYVS